MRDLFDKHRHAGEHPRSAGWSVVTSRSDPAAGEAIWTFRHPTALRWRERHHPHSAAEIRQFPYRNYRGER
jgi:hypothetical protein